MHRSQHIDFFDDMLMIKLNSPQTLAEFEGGTADSLSQLTPFSRECASLWRELYGARRGHYNAKATLAAKEKRTPSRFRKTVLGVLAAARLAVTSSRRVAARQVPQAGGLANPAAGGVLANPAAGTPQSAFWNKSMSNFKKRTDDNIPGVTQTRARPGAPFIPPAGVDLKRKAAACAQPLARGHPYAKVAFLTNTPQERRIGTITGTHRCADADLVVVPDLSILHNVEALAADVGLAVSFVYIVSLGLDITTQQQLDAVRGVPGDLQPLACLRHEAAKAQKLTFRVGARLALDQPDVLRAIRRIAQSAHSKFTVAGVRRAPGAICFNDLRDVVMWACSVRRTRNEVGPKASGVDGVAMPT